MIRLPAAAACPSIVCLGFNDCERDKVRLERLSALYTPRVIAVANKTADSIDVRLGACICA